MSAGETEPQAPTRTPLRGRPDFVPGGAARAGLIITLILLLIGFMSLVWTPWPTGETDLGRQLAAPSLANPLGTDAQGRDLLSVIMRGLLTSYVVAAIGVAIGLFVGVPLGLLMARAGGAGGWIAHRASDLFSVAPALAVALFLAALTGPGTIIAMVAIGFAAVPIVARAACRVISAQHHEVPILASRLAGLSRWEATARHVLPDLSAVLFAETLRLLGFAMLAEAALSYAGLGAQAGGMSLGVALRDAQGALLFEPLAPLMPGVVVVLAAGALLVAGGGLRAALDPQLRDGERDDAVA